MKHKIIILISFILALSFFSQAVSADLIIPGTKEINWCYEISNIDDYPSYIFIYNEERVSGHGVINQEDCFNFYKIGLTKIYAISTEEFNETELNSEFFKENNPKLLESNIQLGAFGSVQENDPLEKAVISLEIQSLTENDFNIQKSKIIYTYNNGTTEEKIFESQEVTPEPSRTAILPWWFAKSWHIILPTAAIVLIIILLTRRLKK